MVVRKAQRYICIFEPAGACIFKQSPSPCRKKRIARKVLCATRRCFYQCLRARTPMKPTAYDRIRATLKSTRAREIHVYLRGPA